MLPPLPTTPPTSAETRLVYVLQHFRAAYADVPTVSIDYQDAQVQLTDGAGAFFSQTNPYPPEPQWREWQGRKLPFFFGPPADKPLLELLPNGRARIYADLISAAFYLLSGWQEYYSEARDRHGRFPFAASVQHRYGFVTVPVVNYYFDLLKTAVEHVTGRPCRPRRWAPEAPYAAFITHDIDNLRSAWKQPAKEALRQGKLLRFGRQLWQHFTQPDAWDNLEQVQQTVAGYGAKSTFFLLPEHRPAASGTPNADYRLTAPGLQGCLQSLAAQGSELAIHGSLGTATDARLLQTKRAQLPGHSIGNRFHYLSWEPRRTPSVLNQVGIAYDTTLGFAEHFGFRHSYCHPFRLFDFQHGQAHDFLEIPLNVMDATLYHPNYLQLAPDEILPALTPMLAEIERFGGVCTVLWHNENFDPANEHNGPRQFHALMEYLRSRHVAFVNGQDICSAVVGC
ncbi:DUF7033 domain-containing protein [Hymenobacter persicinus]|uniref:DUF7033 domain-containing protein n=1 Tax=Hymenobacter persicinus TaxID=2025506 RepID=A0A4Q5LI65_9BACT|nr:hypothetical protein [Hymenobacter persicinus]RYU82401.1 hypothetical protein EWM57_04250 [Hymenobacter persicinus]